MDRSLVKNAADEAQVKAGKRAEKQKELTEKQDLLWLLSERSGRRIYWKWLSACGIFRQSFGEGNDKTNFNEGKRAIGNHMMADLIEIKPAAYAQMTKEAKEDNYKFTAGSKRKANENE